MIYRSLYKKITVIFLFLLSLPIHAAVITSVDRAAFSDAILGGTISSENFDGLVPGTLLGITPEVTYSASGGTPIVTNSFLTTTGLNGLGSTSLGFFFEETATFEFTNPITAFAIDVNTFATGDGSYTATLDSGDIVTSLFETFPGQITGQFIGFVSDTPFTSVTIADTTGFSFTLDTLVWGDAAAVVVPIPGALLLLLSALPILVFRRQRTQ